MISKTLKARTKKIGLPPGSLISLRPEALPEINISVIDYDEKTFIEKKNATLKEALAFLKSPSNSWLNIQGVNDPQSIALIGQHFGLHPLMLEDIMSIGQRSKIDNYKDTLYLVMSLLTYNNEKHSIDEEQVSIVLGSNYVITFLESKKDIFAPILTRLQNPTGQMRQKGADYLCYALVDYIVDSYFLMLEKVDENLEKLENEVVTNPTPATLLRIQKVKRQITMLRKSIWPVRELISNFRRMETSLIKNSTKFYIQDVYDHTIQAIDVIESFRDIASGMIDIYMSNVGHRMNEIMKVLTVVGTIFLPLTFIASFFGMNVDMPGLHWNLSFPIIVVSMILLTIGMVLFFKRKNWL